MNLIKQLLTLPGRTRREKAESAFVRFFKTYLETYDKKDRRVIKQALDRYLAFIDSLPGPATHRNPDRDTVSRFADHLVSTSKGCGAHSTFARFRKVTHSAVMAGILKENPCDGIRMGKQSTLLHGTL